MNTQAPPEKIWQSVLTFEAGDELSLDLVKTQLVRMGYEKEYQVETMGQFALRGGILDIFPLTEENPIRIEMWGDEIDTIRTFDTESQKSIENIDEITIYPACELVLSEEEKEFFMTTKENLLKQEEIIQRGCADIVIDISNLTDEQIIDKILFEIKKHYDVN